MVQRQGRRTRLEPSRAGHEIKTNLHAREGAAPPNFPHALKRTDSELAQQITKDPFTLKFLALDADAAERELEDRLRRPQHQPAVGRLLAADKNESVVRYAVAGTTQPIAVSRYDLSPAEQAALPAEDALTRAVALELDDHTPE